MSYEVMVSFSWDKDFRGVSGKYYSNNVSPKYPYYEMKHKAKDDETTFDYVKGWVRDIIGQSIQFSNKTHKTLITHYLVLQKYGFESFRELWYSEFDYKGKYDYDINKFVFENADDEKDYNEKMTLKDKIETEIALAIINDSFKREIVALRKEKYVMTNGGIFIVKLNNKSYRYTCELNNRVKVFNGLEVLTTYTFKDFEFVKVDDLKDFLADKYTVNNYNSWIEDFGLEKGKELFERSLDTFFKNVKIDNMGVL